MIDPRAPVRAFLRCAVLCALVTSPLSAVQALGSAGVPGPEAGLEAGRLTDFRMPLLMEENRGQAPATVDFVGRAHDYRFLLRAGEIVLAPGPGEAAPRIVFAGADRSAIGRGVGPRPALVNHLRGDDPDKWRVGIPAHGTVRYDDLYPGVDVVFYGNDGRLEYDLVLAPDVDPGTVELDLRGFSAVEIGAAGELVLQTAAGAFVQHPPHAYQVFGAERRRVEARYVLVDETRVRIRLAGFDRALAVVIDPVIDFSITYGGRKKEEAFAIATDPSGNVWLAGTTDSDDLPVDTAALPWSAERAGKHDAFVARFSGEDATLLSATYLGGGKSDRASAIAVDGAGEVVVAGYTDSDDFPTLNAAQALRGGKKDLFVSRFSADGSTLLYSTYVGGDKDERAAAVAADEAGNVFVVGHTRSEDVPAVPEDPDAELMGKRDALVVRLDAFGMIDFSVLLGGEKDDEATGVAIADDRDPVVVGFTKSEDFPVVDPVQPVLGGKRDAFVARLDGVSGALLHSTFLGGDKDDEAHAVAIDRDGAVVVVGETRSKDDFPLVDPAQPAFGGDTDAFVARLAPNGASIDYSTYLGGKKKDKARGVAVDGDGAAHVVGETASKDDFPQVSALQPGFGGGKRDAFVTRLAPDGQALTFSSYLGGKKDDEGQGVAAASSTAIFVVGATKSEDDFPDGSGQPLAGDKEDAFLTRIGYDAPTLAFSVPLDGDTLEDATVTFTVDFAPGEAELDLNSFSLFSNGVDVTEFTMVTETGASYTRQLPEGENTATASIADVNGLSSAETVDFAVEAEVFVFRAIADCAPTSGPVPLTVRLRSRGEFSGGSIVRYRWDFDGNGVFDTNDSVARDYSRSYATQDVVDAVLQVTNNLGDTATDVCRITPSGNPPTASAGVAPSNGPIPLDVQLSCIGIDPDGFIALYEWDFEGDGVFDFSNSTSGDAAHTYAAEGTFVAVCRVTDDDGLTAEARTSTTTIRPAPPGSPTVTGSVSPGVGNAPLSASFTGSAVDDGTIELWEWDFDGDGVFDYSSPASASTSFQYTAGGIFAASLRATDDEGKTGIDTVEVVVNANVSLSILDDTLDLVPSNPGATARVRTTLSAALPVRVLMKDRLGEVVRVLVDEVRAAGTYDDAWDGRDESGNVLEQGTYFAVLEYVFGEETRVLDLTNTTGGSRSNPPRSAIPSSFAPFDSQPLTINYTLGKAAEVTAFIGRFFVDTRLVTFYERLPLGRGQHTITWNGENADGQLIHPPGNDSFLFGIWQYSLASNAIFVHSGAEVSGLSAVPSIFDPTAIVDDQGTPAISEISFTLSNVADVELTVDDAVTGARIARLPYPGLPAGASTIEWDGRDESGVLVAPSRYRLGVAATDSTGYQSVRVYVLQRVYY